MFLRDFGRKIDVKIKGSSVNIEDEDPGAKTAPLARSWCVEEFKGSTILIRIRFEIRYSPVTVN